MRELKESTQRKLSFFATLKTICWSFFGIRKKSAHDQEVGKLNPIYVILAGVLGAAVFIVMLLIIVKSVVASH